MGERTDEDHDGAFGDECREEVRVILGLPDDARFQDFWMGLRDECLQVRRGIETSPNGFRLAPFDMSLTQRITWLQRNVLKPIERLEIALEAENAAHFAHWEEYGQNAQLDHSTLIAELSALKDRAAKLENWLSGEVEGKNSGKIAHTNEIRFYVVHVCLWDLKKCFPDFRITRGQWDKDLGQTVGIIPDYVRRVFQETTGQHEQLDGQIQEVLKSL